MRLWTAIDKTAERQGKADKRLRFLRPRNIGRKRNKIRLYTPTALADIMNGIADGRKFFSP